MMWATIRRKALSAGSSAMVNNGIVQSLERAQPTLAGSAPRGYMAATPMFEAYGRGSKLVPEFNEGAPIYSKSLRDDVSSRNKDFLTQNWIRSFSSYSESAAAGESVVKIETDKGITNNGRVSFTASAGVLGSILSTPIANAPQAANMSIVTSTTSPTFLPNLALFWHMNNGIEEILADYVHHEMTRSLVLVLMRLFLIVAAKDVFVATN